MNRHCIHYKNCGRKAVYELISVKDGKTIHVCECCDENYFSCEICGRHGLWGYGCDEMSYRHDEDESPTCFLCHEKLQKEAEDKLKSDIEKHIKTAMPDCHWNIPQEFKDAMFDDIKNTDDFEERGFYSESDIAFAFQLVVLCAIKKVNPDYGDEGSENHGENTEKMPILQPRQVLRQSPCCPGMDCGRTRQLA